MKPGTRVVSNTFDMGDWEADEKFEVKEGCSSYCRGFFWIVPAKVEGTWKLGGGELAFKQAYQTVTGTLKNGNVVAPITAGRITGDSIAFTAGGTQYNGKINGSTIEGVSKTGASSVEIPGQQELTGDRVSYLSSHCTGRGDSRSVLHCRSVQSGAKKRKTFAGKERSEGRDFNCVRIRKGVRRLSDDSGS